MARHVTSGMMAAGLISGFTIVIAYPHLRKSFHRFSAWLMKNSMKPTDETDKSSDETISYSVMSWTEIPENSDDCAEDSSSESETIADSSTDEQEMKSTTNILKKSEFPQNLPNIAQELIEKLESFCIFTHTVKYKEKEERDPLDKTVYCKNLFLKDRKGKFYYFIGRENNNVHLRQLKYKLHAHRNFSFASADEVSRSLHVQPGTITPFVFLSETVPHDIGIAISRDLMFEKCLNFHPLHPDFTTRISFGHLLKLFGHLSRKLAIIDV